MASGGPTIPGYGELRLLGRGGFATVYVARQLSFDREVAIKVVDRALDDEKMLAQFTRECRAVGSLSWHPHVVPVYDAGETMDGRPYLAMELLPGGSVADALEAGSLELEQALRYAVHVADAVVAAHEVGVLHRDIKPANVLIDRRGAARLADFGIARVKGSDTSTAGSVSGTVAFMAPELLHGERATEASDVYGLGITLATMLLGRNPFQAVTDDTPFAVMKRVGSDPMPDLRSRGIAPPLADLVDACTAKDPAARLATVAEVLVALRAIQGDPSGSRPLRRWALDETIRYGADGRPVPGSVPEPPESVEERGRARPLVPMAGWPELDPMFPIADYDALTEVQIGQMVDGLAPHEVRVVAARERVTWCRPAVLEALATAAGEPALRFPIPDYDRLRQDEVLAVVPGLRPAEIPVVAARERVTWCRPAVLDALGERADDPMLAFPIADYPSLVVAQILPLLPRLDADDLVIVERGESTGAARPEVLSAIARERSTRIRSDRRRVGGRRATDRMP